jgi:hypothetical protein
VEPEFSAIAYKPALMRHPWRIYATNTREFSKQKRDLKSRKNKPNLTVAYFEAHTWSVPLFLTLNLSPPEQAIESVPLLWAFCENCLSLRFFYNVGEIFHSMIMVLAQWESLFFRDVAVVAAFSGYSFGL